MNLKVDIRTLAALITELFQLQDVFALATPEGRWKGLQKWLKQNRQWKSQVEFWTTAPVDEAYARLREWVAEKSKTPLVMLKMIIDAETERLVKQLIAELQTLYKERAAMEERKEIAG